MQDQKASFVAPNLGSPKGTFAFGPYQFDRSNGVLRSNGAELPLQPRVLRLLEHLLERPGEVVSKQELLDAVWADTVVAETSLIEAIKILRQALGDDPQQPTYIQTVHRRGYRFIAPVSVAGEASGPGAAGGIGGDSPPTESMAASGLVLGRRFSARWEHPVAWSLVAVLAVVGTVVGIATWQLTESQGREGALEASVPALAFEERDWVLIAAFENRTGETLFDGTLEAALGSELSNSRFVNVVPGERIADTLRLMRKPADATVDAALGREISLRDGGIRALITGRVEKLDDTYLLSAALVDPADGVTVASFSEEAEGQKEVVPAVRRLSSRVREALGEALPLIRESEMSLAKVTTPSLRALQLYTQGYTMRHSAAGSATAEELMRQAISEDPEFASAYIYLAWTIHNQGQRRPNWDEHLQPSTWKEELLPYAQRAFELADQTSERERYFIRANYFSMTDQPKKMVANYEALLQLDADHFWANDNLYDYYWSNVNQTFILDRTSIDAAYPYAMRAAELRPNNFETTARAGIFLAILMNRPGEAEPYLQRAADLAETDPWASPGTVAWVRLYPAHRRWIEGDLDGVLNEVDRWQETLRSSSGWSRTFLAEEMGKFYTALGMLEAAEEVLLLIDYPALDRRDSRLDEVEYYRTVEEEGVASYLRQGPEVPTNLTQGDGARRLARAGLLSEARDELASFQARRSRQEIIPYRMRDDIIAVNLTRGEIALAEGDAEEAISLLQEGVVRLRNSGSSAYFRGSESLANAWEQQGNPDRALQILEDASQQKNRAYPASITSHGFPRRESAKLHWMRVRLRLAQLYLKLDRETEAREIAAELRALLRYADPDLWLLRQVQALGEETA